VVIVLLGELPKPVEQLAVDDRRPERESFAGRTSRLGNRGIRIGSDLDQEREAG
jgi:hypothetical protein